MDRMGRLFDGSAERASSSPVIPSVGWSNVVVVGELVRTIGRKVARLRTAKSE